MTVVQHVDLHVQERTATNSSATVICRAMKSIFALHSSHNIEENCAHDCTENQL